MNAQDLAEKFSKKVAAASLEKGRQETVAYANTAEGLHDIQHCKIAMTTNVLPFLSELQSILPPGQFSFAAQIELNNHNVVGVSFTIGDGPPTTISTAFGNVIVTHAGASGSSKGVNFVYPPDREPYISNSGDLTREKIAKLVEMTIDNT